MLTTVLITIFFCFFIFNDSLSTPIDNKCLDCICEASSDCDLSLKCLKDYHNNLYCGPYLLTQNFWTIGGNLTGNFKKCSFDKTCAEATIQNYMALNEKDCNQDGYITCEDYALLFPIGSTCELEIAKQTHFWQAFTQTSCFNQSLTLNFSNFDKHDKAISGPNKDTYDFTFENEQSGVTTLKADEVSNSSAKDIRSLSSVDNELYPDDDLYSNLILPDLIKKGISLENSIKPTFTTPNKCFDCLCQASTYCDLDYGCQNGYCGPYALSYIYFQEINEPLENFAPCVQDKSCSEEILRRYILKNYQDCNGDRFIDCDDFALIYKFGQNCNTNESYSLDFFNHVEYCTILSDKARRDPEFHSIIKHSNTTADYDTPSFNRSLIPPFTVRLEDQRKTVITQDVLEISRMCMECICEASSGCNVNENICRVNSSCGPYEIDKNYWSFCGRPGYRGAANDFDRCANSLRCSQKCVRQFINTYVIDCNQDGVIDCIDYSMLHKLGPNCDKNVNLENFYKSNYWTSFNHCFGFE